ncbi:MAG: type III pantothenate kinase [Bacilli bacterium]|nr:type III pantothenate kinase [Bacilli bacterium]
MVITFDLGNSDLVLGLFEEHHLVTTIRIKTDVLKSSDEYSKIIKELLVLNNIDLTKIEGGIISSVVPPLNEVLKGSFKQLFKKEPLFVGNGLKSGIKIIADNPLEVGADLIADCLGAKIKYSLPALIIDLGTASKVLLLDENGSFSGCVIAPGIKTSTLTLANSASQLPHINMKTPKKVLGRNTMDAMNSGVCYGFSGMIDGIVNRIEHELGYQTTHILTGGLANVVKDNLMINFIQDDNLILDGLYEMYLKNVKG